jgi:hypothetical protein
MIEAATSLIKSKSGKQVVFFLGTAVLFLTAVHYYHQIKLTRMKITELDEKSHTHDN